MEKNIDFLENWTSFLLKDGSTVKISSTINNSSYISDYDSTFHSLNIKYSFDKPYDK